MRHTTIFGAIAGDIIGSVYEFNPTKDYNFNLYDDRMRPTDDSVMTVAVADWIMHDATLSRHRLADIMRKWGRRYPTAGYGGHFFLWLSDSRMGPYNSWGNGSAMRVSPVGFAFDTLEQTLEVAKTSAEVTHNHPEGIKGAQATAAAIYLARNGMDKKELRRRIAADFGYSLNMKCRDIRKDYKYEISCQKSVPQSICALLDSTSYESAIRETISLGGDADTMGAITGGIAAAFYGGMPDGIYNFVRSKTDSTMLDIIDKFDSMYVGRLTRITTKQE